MKGTLKDKNKIDLLFKTGRSRSIGYILIKSIDSDKTEVMFTVSSKKFSRAVDRNRIKRLMREAFRGVKILNKCVAVIYIGNKLPNLKDLIIPNVDI